MPWNNQGGGWQGGQGPWGGRPGGGGGGPQPPDLEELLRRGQEKIRQIFPGGGGGGGAGNFFANKKAIAFVGMVAVAVWLASGFYRVQPDEQGVVLMFGALSRVTSPGLNYHLPYPIETVQTPSVERINRVEIGFRSAAGTGPRAQGAREVPSEALMLTGDENIVDINFVVLWRISSAADFLFNVREPGETVKDAGESVMREILGQTEIADALAEGRRQIEDRAREMLQELLNDYGAGVQVTEVQLQKVDPPGEVIDAFRDVQRAQADRERLQNEAEAFANDILPRARGEAERLTQEAQAYRQEVVARADGDAQRFVAVLTEYHKAQDVTLRRIYLETMEDILTDVNKIIIDGPAQGAGVLPYLPLPDFERRQREAVAGQDRQVPEAFGAAPTRRDSPLPTAAVPEQGRFGQVGGQVGSQLDRLVSGDR
jgi:modulator of FtsH protease HflK